MKKNIKDNIKGAIALILAMFFCCTFLKILYTHNRINIIISIFLLPFSILFSLYMYVFIHDELINIFNKKNKVVKYLCYLGLSSLYVFPIPFFYHYRSVKINGIKVDYINNLLGINILKNNISSLFFLILLSVFVATIAMLILTFLVMMYKYHIKHVLKERLFFKDKTSLIVLFSLGFAVYFLQISNPILAWDDYGFAVGKIQFGRIISEQRWLISLWSLISGNIDNRLKSIIYIACLVLSSYSIAKYWKVKYKVNTILISSLLILNPKLAHWSLWINTEFFTILLMFLSLSCLRYISKGYKEKLVFVFYIILLNASYQQALVYIGIVMLLKYVKGILFDKNHEVLFCKHADNLFLEGILLVIGFIVSFLINKGFLFLLEKNYPEHTRSLVDKSQKFNHFLQILLEKSHNLQYYFPVIVFMILLVLFKKRKNIKKIIATLFIILLAYLSIYSSIIIFGEKEFGNWAYYPFFVIFAFSFFVILKYHKKIGILLALFTIFILASNIMTNFSNLSLETYIHRKNLFELVKQMKIYKNYKKEKKIFVYCDKGYCKEFSHLLKYYNFSNKKNNEFEFFKHSNTANKNKMPIYAHFNNMSYFPKKNSINISKDKIYIKFKTEDIFINPERTNIFR